MVPFVEDFFHTHVLGAINLQPKKQWLNVTMTPPMPKWILARFVKLNWSLDNDPLYRKTCCEDLNPIFSFNTGHDIQVSIFVFLQICLYLGKLISCFPFMDMYLLSAYDYWILLYLMVYSSTGTYIIHFTFFLLDLYISWVRALSSHS